MSADVSNSRMAKEWRRNLEELGDKYPELMELNSPLRLGVAELLKKHSFLHSGGDGIRVAVQMALLELAGPTNGGDSVARAPALAEVIEFPKPTERPQAESLRDHVPCPFHLKRWCLQCDG